MAEPNAPADPDPIDPDTSDPDTSDPDPAEVDALPSSPLWSAGAKRLIGSAFALTLLLVGYLSRNVLALAALAGLIAFLISPLIRIMHTKLHVPRALALLAAYVAVFLGFVVMGVLIADGAVGAARDIDVTEAEESLRSTAEDTLSAVREITVAGYTIDLSETVDPLLEKVSKPVETTDSDGSPKRVALSTQQIEHLFGGISSTARTLSSAVVAAFMSAIITALVAMYLSADSEKFRVGAMSLVPPGYEGDAERLGTRTLRIWRGYLYGQVFNSVTVAAMMWLILWLIGLPGAFMFALILGLLNMIPTFGPIIAAVPAVLAAFALGSTKLDWSRLGFTLLIVFLYVVVVQLHANLMAPFITGKAVKLSPATIMIGLLVGVHVGGIVGALLVVPVIATGKEYGRYVIAKLTDRDPFEALAPEPDPAPAPAPTT